MLIATVREIRETAKGRYAELQFDNGGYSIASFNNIIVSAEEEWKVGDMLHLYPRIEEKTDKREEEI